MAARRYEGTILAETYKLESRIGKGGMGVVYRASHTRLPRQFAIKILNANLAADNKQLERFQSEAEIACSVANAHVVEIFDFNKTADGLAYIVMELLDGQDLAARILEAGQLGLTETVTILAQVADALEATHSRGVIHRDLKPPNIFLCRQKQKHALVKVLDFGLAKLQQGRVRTQTGMVFGTPGYMAPEQAMAGLAKVTQQTDVWAIGVILYECLTGQLPFAASSVQATLEAICYQEAKSIRDLRPEISAAVEAVVFKALCKKPEDRYEGVGALRDAFSKACEHSWSQYVGNSEAVKQLDGLKTRPFPEAADEPTQEKTAAPALADTAAPAASSEEDLEPTIRRGQSAEAARAVAAHVATGTGTGRGPHRSKLIAGASLALVAALLLTLLASSGSDAKPKGVPDDSTEVTTKPAKIVAPAVRLPVAAPVQEESPPDVPVAEVTGAEPAQKPAADANTRVTPKPADTKVRTKPKKQEPKLPKHAPKKEWDPNSLSLPEG